MASSSKPITDKEYVEIIKDSISSGENVFLTGPGGCGKTYTIHEIYNHFTIRNVRLGLCATTGIAAKNLHKQEDGIFASTFHSFFGIGLAQGSFDKILESVQNNKYACKRIKNSTILILDEVSMLGGKLFETVDKITRIIRKSDRVFGGMQIIFAGDFLQLSPVKDGWVFKSEMWRELQFKTFIFESPKRYSDTRWFELLLRVRNGTPTDNDIKKLYSRVKAYDKLMKIFRNATPDELKMMIRPTMLYSKKIDVEGENERELAKLPGKCITLTSTDTFVQRKVRKKRDYYVGLLDDMIASVISLKVGAQVMLRKNLDVEAGLVNGSRGVVVDISPDAVLVRFLCGNVIRIIRHEYSAGDKYARISRDQFPLSLAWACTIHKSQSLTLDTVSCDLGSSVFAEGQSYVAMSRVRSITGLFLKDFDPRSIQACPEALEFYKSLEQNVDDYKSS